MNQLVDSVAHYNTQMHKHTQSAVKLHNRTEMVEYFEGDFDRDPFVVVEGRHNRMLDEGMSNKYTLPESYDGEKGTSKKRRAVNGVDTGAASEPSDHPHGYSKGEDQGGRHGKGQRKEAGKGEGKGGRKGQNRGKGRSENPATVQQSLATQAKLVLRLEAERREQNRTVQWAIDFKMPYAFTNVLTNAVDVYRASKPEKERHPEGTLHDVQWSLFADHVFKEMQKVEATAENKGMLSTLCEMLKHLVI